MDDDYNDAVEQSTFANSATIACKFILFYFPYFVGFLKNIFFFFFFVQSYYKGNSLHDYKFKNTQECTT